MATFAYNNVENASIGHFSIKLNYSYYPYIFFKKDTNLCL